MNWRFWVTRKPADDTSLRDWFAWESDMRKRGFSNWIYNPPPSGAYVEVSRREWPMIQVWGVDSVRPEINIVNLWWRESRDLDDKAGGIIEVTKVSVGGVGQYQTS